MRMALGMSKLASGAKQKEIRTPGGCEPVRRFNKNALDDTYSYSKSERASHRLALRRA
jgi:hypothetical protein